MGRAHGQRFCGLSCKLRSHSMLLRRRSNSGESLRRRMWEAGSASSGGGGGTGGGSTGGGEGALPGGGPVSPTPSGGSMPELCNMEMQPSRTRRVGPCTFLMYAAVARGHTWTQPHRTACRYGAARCPAHHGLLRSSRLRAFHAPPLDAPNHLSGWRPCSRPVPQHASRNLTAAPVLATPVCSLPPGALPSSS